MPITDPTWIFFTVLGIILFAPMLLERLRVPSIVGMIFAGILVGPHGLHVLDRDSSFELFGKVGLYYIMFLASLEMNLQDVRLIKGRAATLGLLSFLFPMALGVGANMGLLGYGAAAATLMGAMYASHTLIAYPVVLRYGLGRLKSVSIAVGGTIVADTLTLLVLAVVGGMYKDGAAGLFWLWLPLKVVGLGLVILLAFPPLGRWFFRRYDDGVAQYVFVLTLVFLGAGLMALAGMEGILGAFLAGIALNRLIPPSSPLMAHIEFVGNALFIPYFLIGVGMIINLGALVTSPRSVLVAVVMVAVALAGKWLAAYGTQKIYGMERDERSLMFGLTGSRAAATLAVVLVGHGIVLPGGTRLLGDEVLNGAMVLILVTCVVSSLVTERTSRRLAVRRALGAAEEKGSPQRVLIALKYGESVSPLVNLALMMRTPHVPSPIVALNVVLEDAPAARQDGLACLEKAERLAAAANVRIQTHSRWSVNVVTGISHAVKENDASDLLIGQHQKAKLSDSFYGKLGNDILDCVPRQVMIYRGTLPPNTLRRVHLLVPRKAEYEPGFAHWMNRVALLVRQLGCPLDVYGESATMRAMAAHWAGGGVSLPVSYHLFTAWGDFLSLAHLVRQDHLAVFVCARRGSISRQPYHDRLPQQVERYFSSRSLLLIYPSQPAVPAGKTADFRAGVPLSVR